MTVEQIARVCHETNRAYAISVGEDPAMVHPVWEQAGENIKDSARIGVEHALKGATPKQLHESWTTTKIADGWVYGAVRDNSAKLHPCLVPYETLPPAQRKKDALFSAVVSSLR